MKSVGDKEEMEIKDRRVRAFAKEIAKEYAALAIKQANEQADEIAKQADVVIRKAEQVEKDYADMQKEFDKMTSMVNAFKSRWLEG